MGQAGTKATRVKSAYPVSDDFIAWIESLSGLLTTVKTRHGGIVAMIEDSGWDDSRTGYALRLVQSLSRHMVRIEKEFESHVKSNDA